MSGPDVRWDSPCNAPASEMTLRWESADSAARSVRSGNDASAWIVLALLVACTLVALLDLFLLYAAR